MRACPVRLLLEAPLEEEVRARLAAAGVDVLPAGEGASGSFATLAVVSGAHVADLASVTATLIVGLGVSVPGDARVLAWPAASDAASLTEGIVTLARALGAEDASVLRARLEEHERLLRLAMLDKGEMVVRQLEVARTHASEQNALRRIDLGAGLLRHGAFRTRIAFEIERSRLHGESVGLLFADLDHFSAFNRSHGFAAGDRALEAFARIVGSLWDERSAARPPVLGREGADSVGVLLPATSLASLVTLAEAVREAVERLPFAHGRLTTSVGGVLAAPGATDDIVALAQSAVTLARAGGGNRARLVACAPGAAPEPVAVEVEEEGTWSTSPS